MNNLRIKILILTNRFHKIMDQSKVSNNKINRQGKSIDSDYHNSH